jgi:DNA repair exonuclease SbcCD ATPase subunit/predicted phosphodiesterase
MVRIAHLADIHIMDRRRDEYAEIFELLYADLRERKPDIIAVVGDIFDHKLRATAHNIADVIKFFVNLVSIAPVIVITGNHDTNCLTPGSLDLLTPVLSDHAGLQPPALTYFRHSGVYTAHDITWSVIATDGDLPPPAKPDGLHICLFHEEVNNAMLPNGIRMEDYKLSMASFDNYDVTMGGHIHLRQMITPTAAYCGSLIQQNIGEHHNGHGYMMWECGDTIRAEGIDILNKRGFLRVNIDSGGNDITELPIPTDPIYWEIMHDELTPQAAIDTIRDKYVTQFDMVPRAVRAKTVEVQDGSAPTEPTMASSLSAAQAASRTLSAHEEIIRTLLASDPNVDRVIDMHRESWVDPEGYIAGGKFRLLQFEFSNLYAFGPANAIDFTKLEGCVSGVIATNHTGKSSLIEAILFALYEIHPRAPIKSDVVRRGMPSGQMKLTFELDGKIGIIEKSINGELSVHGRAVYRFMYNGEDRTKGGMVDTVAEIRSVIGDPMDALAGSFQLQGSETHGFINVTPANRKKLLASVMSLGSFESIERLTAKKLTAANSAVKLLEGQYHGTSAENLRVAIAETTIQYDMDASEVKSLALSSAAQRDHTTSLAKTLGSAQAEVKHSALEISKFTAISDAELLDYSTDIANWQGIIGSTTLEDDQISAEQCEFLIEMPVNTSEHIENLTARMSDACTHLDTLSTQARADELKVAAVLEPSRSVEELDTFLSCVKEQICPYTAPTKPSFPRVGRSIHPAIATAVHGVRPTIAEIALTVNAIAVDTETISTASKWDAAKYAQCVKTLPVFDFDANTTQMDKLTDAHTKIMARRTALIDELRLHKYPKLDVTGYTPVGLDITRSRLQIANDKLSAAKYLARVKGKLEFNPTCASCTRASRVFTAPTINIDEVNIAHNSELLSVLSTATGHAKECDVEKLEVSALRVAALTAKQSYEECLVLDDAKRAHEIVAKWDTITQIIQRMNYWNQHDALEWTEYDFASKTYEINFNQWSLNHDADEIKSSVEANSDLVQWGQLTAAKKTYDESIKCVHDAREQHSAASAQLLLSTQSRARSIRALHWCIKAQADSILKQSLSESQRVCRIRHDEYVQIMASTQIEFDASNALCVENAARLTEMQQSVAQYAKEITQKTAELQYEVARFESLSDATTESMTLKSYRAVLRPAGGIGDKLLDRGRALLESKINDGLRELGAKFGIGIDAEYNVNISMPHDKTLPASLGSGYQKFVLSLAARLAIWRFSDNPRPDAFIIDEGFGSCDEEYLDSMACALETLATSPQGPKLLFIVSHVDVLKMRVEKALEIIVNPTGSYVANTKSTQALMVADEAPDIGELVVDPERDGYLHCAACRKSILVSGAKRHLGSKTHASAIERILKQDAKAAAKAAEK